MVVVVAGPIQQLVMQYAPPLPYTSFTICCSHQLEHDRYKAEATRRLEAETAAAAALRAQLAALEEQAQGLRERVEALSREREQAEETHNARLAELRADVVKQEGVAQQAAVRSWVCISSVAVVVLD